MELNHSFSPDFYHLTMAQGYYYSDKKKLKASFEVFFRNNPFKSGYTVFTGLQPLLDKIKKSYFSDDLLQKLGQSGTLSQDFLDFLRDFQFKGDIFSLQEGDIVFPSEPVMRFEGNIIEVQIIESLVLNILNFQMFIATKSSRIKYACQGKDFFELGLRRAYGIDGAISSTRASIIGGAKGSSNVLALNYFDIALIGTMSHSWILAYESELESFLDFGKQYPKTCVFLIDTYSVLNKGLPNAIKAFQQLIQQNILTKESFKAVRIDSGDLASLATSVRKVLDDNNLNDVKIMVSNDLDEYIITELLSAKAPIDSFGVGTQLVTGGNFTNLSGVYKMVAYQKGHQNDWVSTMKISDNSSKSSLPGQKNILRFFDKNHFMLGDLICLQSEVDAILTKTKKGEPITCYQIKDVLPFEMKNYAYSKSLLSSVFEKGEQVVPVLSLQEIKNQFDSSFQNLDKSYKRFTYPHIYKVGLSEKLNDLRFSIHKKITSS